MEASQVMSCFGYNVHIVISHIVAVLTTLND
jgi:hypothetical protein